jgi:hypothetical protein
MSTSSDEVSKIATKLASYVNPSVVLAAKARYGEVGEDLLAFAVALEIGLPALQSLQVAQEAARKKENDELREIIRLQELRLTEYAENTLSAIHEHESTQVDHEAEVHISHNMGDETIAAFEDSSDG